MFHHRVLFRFATFLTESLNGLLKKETRMTRKWFFIIMFLPMIFLPVSSLNAKAVDPGLKIALDSVFVGIETDFDKIMASPAVAKNTAAAENGYFFTMLKENQVYYSFLSVDKKGFTITEVIRMVENPDMKKRKVTGEAWFKDVSKRLKKYTSLIKQEETGRYYLFYAAPLISKNKRGKDTFAGAVALKIDLWDCFQKFSKSTSVPFLIRLKRMTLYSHLWSNDIAYKEEGLKIAGIKKITVRYPKVMEAPTLMADTVPSVDSSSIKAAEDSLKALVQAKQKNNKKLIVVVVLCTLLLIIVISIVGILSSRRHKKILEEFENRGKSSSLKL
jgi:hypothetical protein